MTDTPNLNLPYLDPAQAQKHVTHNEALRALDAIVQLNILDRNLTAPPGSPTDGDRYIVATGGTGDWAGHDGAVAAWQDNAWIFYAPGEGWLAYVADEDALLAFNGSSWNAVSSGGGGGSETAAKFGINTIADLTNRLAVKSDALLFNHDDVTPGTGDIRAVLNKNLVGDTASFLFQSNSSGRAEIGLTGDDDFHFKVSGDGVTWFDAIIIDKATGIVSTPQAPSLQVKSTSAQSIANSSVVTLSWDGENWDIGDMHDVSVNPTRLIAQTAGKYIVHMNIVFSGNNSGVRQLMLRKNGSGTLWSHIFGNSGAGEDQTFTGYVVELAAGDYIEGQVWQNSGSTLTVSNASVMSMTKVGA